GVGRHARRSYRIWEEGKPPTALFEIGSEGTWREDLGAKRSLYATLEVREYFIFDPHLTYLDPPLQGFRTDAGRSVPLAPGADGSVTSTALDLRLSVEGRMVRLFDLRNGKPILTRREQAEQLEAENARLRELLARHGIQEL